MLSRVHSITLQGLRPCPITIEVDARRGQPKCMIVGLADAAIREAEQRVKSAIKNSGFEYWSSWMTINLAPSDLRKEGSAFDVPIAVGVLLASRVFYPFDEELLNKTIIVGELSLDGNIKHITGILPMVAGAKQIGARRVVVPFADVHEAACIKDIEIIGVSDIRELVDILSGDAEPRAFTPEVRKKRCKAESSIDLHDIRGQEHAKRAIEIAAAGKHNILLTGPPGSGKTMLAKALQTLMSDMSETEALAVAMIHSLAGILPRDTPLSFVRPFRSPHHTASSVSLVGGGGIPRPGEISLAHHGILFLDELPEFPRAALEVLREPLEAGAITIARAQMTVSYPAQFTLVAAMNPCPCGYATDPAHPCQCTAASIARYRHRISGPLLDRIDMHVTVPRVPVEKLQSKQSTAEEESAVVRERIVKAHAVQCARFNSDRTNSSMSVRELDQYCAVNDQTKSFLARAMHTMHLSARGYHRVLKVARTIADLAGSEGIVLEHVAEAVQYRSRVT